MSWRPYCDDSSHVRPQVADGLKQVAAVIFPEAGGMALSPRVFYLLQGRSAIRAD